jgi:hypothetical protein
MIEPPIFVIIYDELFASKCFPSMRAQPRIELLSFEK